VVELVTESERTKSIVLDHPGWAGHRAGQHVDVRLTAEDGYQAERSYSIASAPEDEHLVLTIERLEDGEVSPYLTGELIPGDELELRGPIGGYFIWEEAVGGPLLMLAGGSGVVPFRAMLRHWVAAGGTVPARLLYSTRSPGDLIYGPELDSLGERAGLDVDIVYTRAWPDGWTGRRGRVTPDVLAEVTFPVTERPQIYICGPGGFVEAMAETLVGAGHEAGRIRTERFGPSGG
jgi:ferredoxin-NADP reductase